MKGGVELRGVKSCVEESESRRVETVENYR